MQKSAREAEEDNTHHMEESFHAACDSCMFLAGRGVTFPSEDCSSVSSYSLQNLNFLSRGSSVLWMLNPIDRINVYL